jgi:ADP-heptose:LPS heptosyltransferase
VRNAPSISAPEGFTYVGEGRCLSSKGKQYDYFFDLGRKIDNDCLAYCSQVKHRWFVGVSTGSWCECLFSGGLPKDVDATDYNPTASRSFLAFAATGPVQTTNGDPTISCYRYEVSFLSSH